jgi:DNA-binding NtrC family response regulator
MEDLIEIHIETSIVPLHEVPSFDLETRSEDRAPLILIVDDEPLIVDTLAAIISRTGYRTLRAYGGKMALQLALVARPDLLISDVCMPDLDGPSLAMCVVDSLPRCRVLLASGHATRHALDATREAGHNFTLLQKPIPPAEMLRHIYLALNTPTEDYDAAPKSNGFFFQFQQAY